MPQIEREKKLNNSKNFANEINIRCDNAKSLFSEAVLKSDKHSGEEHKLYHKGEQKSNPDPRTDPKIDSVKPELLISLEESSKQTKWKSKLDKTEKKTKKEAFNVSHEKNEDMTKVHSISTEKMTTKSEKVITSGIIFENFVDSNSEFKMNKIVFKDQEAAKLFLNIKHTQVQILGFYGDFVQAIKMAENFLKKSLEDLTALPYVSSDEFEGIIMAVNDEKVAFILKSETGLFNKYPAESSLNFVTYLRFLIDFANKIVIIPPMDFKFNAEEKSPFSKESNKPMMIQETVTKPSGKIDLKLLTMLDNHVCSPHLTCYKDFNSFFFKVTCSRTKIIFEKKIYYEKRFLEKKSFFASFIYPTGTMEVSELIETIKREWIKSEDFFFDGNREFERRIKGIFELTIEGSKRQLFQTLCGYFQSTYIKERNQLITKNDKKISEKVNSEFKKILDYLTQMTHECRKTAEHDSLKSLRCFEIVKELKKRNFNEIQIEKWTSVNQTFYITENVKNTLSSTFDMKSKELENFKKTEMRNLENEIIELRRKTIVDFFDNVKEYIDGTLQEFTTSVEIGFYRMNIIRDGESVIKNWNYTNVSTYLSKKINLSTKNEILVDKVLLIDEKNAFVVIEIKGKYKEFYHVDFTSKTNLQFKSILKSSTVESMLVINSLSKLWCIYNNATKRIDLGRINNFHLDNGVPIEIYNKCFDEIAVTNILSLSLVTDSDQILFLDQNNRLLEYKSQSMSLRLVVKRENKGGESVEIVHIRPTQESDVYREIQSSPDGKFTILLSGKSLDIYDLSWSKVIQLDLRKDFLQFKIFTDQISNILSIINESNVECYELAGTLAFKTLNIKDLNDSSSKIDGNPIFDYIFHTFKKFGTHSGFLGCPAKTDFYIIDVHSNLKSELMTEYFELLNLKKTTLTYKKNFETFSKKIKELDMMSVEDLKFIVISRVPLHIATIENYTLMPLQNGKIISEHINSLFWTDKNIYIVQQITNLIEFGSYESLIKSINSEVVVISICGRQSSGKSYVMNRFFGTRFDVASTRCTDGIWMSVSSIKKNVGRMTFVVLDCEGLFSTRRTEDEEMKMCLALSAISDIMILNQDLSFNRYLNRLFSNFSRSVGRLKSNHLFKGCLMMLIRDVTTTDSKAAYEELISNLYRQDKEKNPFLMSLFNGKLIAQCLNYYEKKIFDQEILEIRTNHFLKLQTNRWKSGQEFIDCFKFTMTQIFMDDDSDMDEYRVKQRLENNLENCQLLFHDMTSLSGEGPVYSRKFKINDSEIELRVQHKDIQFETQDIQSENEFYKIQKILSRFLEIVGERTEINHNAWISTLQEFLTTFLKNRVEFILNHFDVSNPKDTKFEELVDRTRTKLNDLLENFVLNSRYCDKTCRICRRVCIKKRGHEKDCDCNTTHYCSLACQLTPICEDNNFKCIDIFGHDGNHRCLEGRHKCVESCTIEACEVFCGYEKGHSDLQKHHCLNKHPCSKGCEAIKCTKKCYIDREIQHSKHDCGIAECLMGCVQCDKLCAFPDHFHAELIEKKKKECLLYKIDHKEIILDYHSCENEHGCNQKCNVEGICQIDFEIKEAIWKNRHGEYNYIKYIPKEVKMKCSVKKKKANLHHEGIHKCDLLSQHRCREQCPECSSFCNKAINHEGPHYTSVHRNKQNSVFISATGENIVRIESGGISMAFSVGESCEPENCSSSCSRRGRGHYHLKECKGEKECSAKINQNVRHSTHKFAPYEDLTFDIWLCKNFWASNDWEMPVREDLVDTIPLCSHVCTSNVHELEKNISFCTLKAWHEGRHNFTCIHPITDFSNIDVAFVMDTTGSMGSYLNNSKNAIKRIISDFTKRMKTSVGIQVGFVAYRDHPPEDSTYVTMVQDFTTETKMIEFIDNLDARGGGDAPEAVLDGLNDAVKKLIWRNDSVKYLFHIGDAPPHGKEYCTYADGFPTGCPCGLKIENIAAMFREKKIKYKLLKIGDSMNLMVDKFKAVIDNFECTDLNTAVHLEAVISEIISKDVSASDLDFKKS